MIIEVKCKGHSIFKMNVWSMILMMLFRQAPAFKRTFFLRNIDELQLFCDDVEQAKPDTWDMDT